MLAQSVVELGTRCRLQHIPHLGLAVTLAVAAGRLFVGVYLYAQVLVGVDELDEEWELVAEAFVVLLAHKPSLLLVY